MKHFSSLLKSISVLVLLLAGIVAHTQELKERQLRTLSSLGLPYQDFDLANEKIHTDFRNILKFEKRRKAHKIAGSILLPLGAAATGLGISMISNNKYRHPREQADFEESSGHPLGRAIGSTLVVVGAAQIAVSIPMFVGSGSKKRRRNRLLSTYGVANIRN